MSYDPQLWADGPTCDQCGEVIAAHPEAGLAEHQCPAEQDCGDEPGTCWICDGVGHGYVVGWHDVPGKGTQPIIDGGPCPVEEPPGSFYEDERF